MNELYRAFALTNLKEHNIINTKSLFPFCCEISLLKMLLLVANQSIVDN